MVISDKTVQVPEYLGGGRYHVNINQIVQTSGQQTNADTPIGETGAMSVTPINESSFIIFRGSTDFEIVAIISHP